MARLFTSEDPWNLHKSLGLAVLLHFCYRLHEVAVYGRAFSATGAGALGRHLLCVSLHCMLSLSSYIPRVPPARNYAAPMIWPEFRAHNLVFCLRHVGATALALVASGPEAHRPACFDGMLFRFALGAALVFTASEAADAITKKIGCRERRTTSAMPYPPWLASEDVAAIKDFYITAQFGAICSSCTFDPTYAFGALYGLQLSPFCMTLVRKGRISAASYHRIYALSLLVPYLMGARMAFNGKALLLLQLGAASTAVRALRVQAHAPRWAVALTSAALCCSAPSDWTANEGWHVVPGALEFTGKTCAVASLINKPQIYRLFAADARRAVASTLAPLLTSGSAQEHPSNSSSRAKCLVEEGASPSCFRGAVGCAKCNDDTGPAAREAVPRHSLVRHLSPSPAWMVRLRDSALQILDQAFLGQIPTPVLVGAALAIKGGILLFCPRA